RDFHVTGVQTCALPILDALVSNAYRVTVAPAHATSLSDFNDQLAVTLTATFLGVRACLDDLLARGGSVVAVSSVHALVGLPGRRSEERRVGKGGGARGW